MYGADLPRIPDSGVLHHGRGIALCGLNKFDEAQHAFTKALEMAPLYADAWVSMGDLHFARKEKRLARAAFLKALAIDALTPGAWAGFCDTSSWVSRWIWRRRLSAREALLRQRRRDKHPEAAAVISEAARLGKSEYHAEAINVLRACLETCPGHVNATATLCALLAGLGNVEQGRRGLERLVQWWPSSASASYCLGAYLMTVGEKEAGIKMLQRSLALDPEDKANARFALSTLGVAPLPRLADAEVRGIFDAYADKFDHDLRDNLEYRVPEIIAARIAGAGRRWPCMLDLGCGTGLCGVQMRAHVDRLIGVDLSEKMLRKAQTRRIYDVLQVGEAASYLERSSESFDLMIAADVLVYIGDVTALFGAVAARLARAGEFWFSVEVSEREGVHITMSRRYQHSLGYLESSARAAGLRVKHQQPTDIRRHANEMQKGLLVALERDV